MRVYFFLQSKQAACTVCELPIERGDRALLQVTTSSAKKTLRFRKHLQCFWDYLQEYYEDFELITLPRGRKPATIPPEHKAERHKLTVRWSRLYGRAIKAVTSGDWTLKKNIDQERIQVRNRMKEIGGVPTGWG